jgi:isochorismate synthase
MEMVPNNSFPSGWMTKVGFASFSLPGHGRFSTYLQNQPGGELLSESGRPFFLFHPFDSSGPSPKLAVRADVILDDLVPGSNDLVYDFLHPSSGCALNREVSGKGEYLLGVEEALREIRQGRFRKLVLSRPFLPGFPVYPHIRELVLSLRQTYPSAFVYWIRLSGMGDWVGASPESLLSETEGIYHTESLAGTRPGGSQASQWGEKEMEEQRIVTEFIEGRLKVAGATGIRMSREQTKRAGPVEHLCTSIAFESRAGILEFMRIADLLHPTPAVCGDPQSMALDWLRLNEGYDRTYYGGYLGPVGSGFSSLFVNIRCMELFSNESILYVGGGITRDSEPKKEWEETYLKATTLLAVMEKFRTFAP